MNRVYDYVQVCPVCAALPGGEPNLVTDDIAGHLTLEHRSGPRDLISFLISLLIHFYFVYFEIYLTNKCFVFPC